MTIPGCSGDGLFSDPVDERGDPITVSLAVTAETPSEINLSWIPPNATVSNYTITRNGSEFDFTTHATSYADRNLRPGTRYCYVVSALLFPIAATVKSNQACTTTPNTTQWSKTTITNGDYIDLDLDNTNNMHISYRNSNGVHYATNRSGQWITSIVDGNAGSTGQTDIAVSPIGQAHITYRDSQNNMPRYGNNITGVWITEKLETPVYYPYDVTLGLSESIHISAITDRIIGITGRSLIYVTGVPGSWQFSTVSVHSGLIFNESDIRIDSLGYVHIAYAATTLNCLVYYANNIGGNWINEILSESAQPCHVSMDLDSNDIPHISFMDDFQLVYATNPSSEWLVSTVDNFSWVPGRSSIDIDNFDGIHISYQDNNTDLKYAHLEQGTWEINYLDSIEDVGFENVIKVDAAGRVSILYTDDTNGTIELVKSP